MSTTDSGARALDESLLETAERPYPDLAGWLGAVIAGLGLLLAIRALSGGDHSLLSLGIATAAIARGVALRRPPVAAHVAAALLLVVFAGVAAGRDDTGVAQVALVLAGVVALWPPPPPLPGTATERRHVRSLVNLTAHDPLAPFALRADKSYVFSPDGRAALAYRVRFGVAVVSGDPLGDPGSRLAAAEAFITLVTSNGWRVGVLGAGEAWAEWWAAQGLRAVPIGRDVVIDVNGFGVAGRAFRNLRQAVQRTRNAGVTTEIYQENELPQHLREQLQGIVKGSRRNANRGFSMILDGLLDPTTRGTLLAVAFDRTGRPVGFHRFGTADGGREISQDLPWRVPGAPNGVDERLAYDTIMWARENGAHRLSLSFAAFPELYAQTPDTRLERVSYWATHRLDRFIRLESLYRYLRKFHALGDRRYVLLRLRDLVPVAVAMLTLEFSSYRRRRTVRWWWARLRRAA